MKARDATELYTKNWLKQYILLCILFQENKTKPSRLRKYQFLTLP